METAIVVAELPNAGVNSMTIDTAEECKRLGAKTIGVAGSPWQEKTPADHPSRHPSRKNLKDMVDIYIDDYNPLGDAVLNIEGLLSLFTLISSITDGYIVRRIEIEAVKYMISKVYDPPVWVIA